MPIRAVIFDFGGVLCPMPQPAEFEPLRQITGLSEAAFQEYFWRERLDYDRGTTDGAAYWRRFARLAAISISEQQIPRLIALDLAMWQKLDPTVMEWIHRLRLQNIKTGILSNMGNDLAPYLRKNAEWLKQFDHVILSGELQLVKPEAGIYRASLSGLGVQPEEALFLDDNPANIEGAQALGIQAVRFLSTTHLEKDLQRLGLPPLP